MNAPPILYPIWLLDRAPVSDCLSEVAGAGFDGVSFLAAPVDDPRRLDRLDERAAAELRERLAAGGLRRTLHIASDYYFAGLSRRSEGACRRARSSIERCIAALTSSETPPLIVSLDPICLPPGPKGVLDPPLIVEMLGFLTALGERYPIRVALENWPKPGVGTPEALREVLAAAPGPVGILLDLGHLNLALRSAWCPHRTPRDFILALPAPVLEVHLHDNHGEVDEHLPPGVGTSDMEAAFDALGERGFQGFVTVEADVRGLGRDGMREALRRARALAARASAGHARREARGNAPP